MVVAGSDHGTNSGKMRRVRDCRKHLRGAHVRPAKHSDLAIRIRKSGGPLDRVVSVVRFVFECVPLAFGGVAATNVFDNHDESTRGTLQAEISLVVFVV